MRGEKKMTRAFAIALMVLLGILTGCAKDGNHPLAPQNTGDFLDEIVFLERTSSSPVLNGDDPMEVSFTVTPEDGGSGEVDFVSFEVEPGAVKEEVTITITVEDPDFYVVELDSDRNVKLKEGTLSIHVESRDLTSNEGDISLYMETKHGWKKLPGKINPGGSDMVGRINRLSRYALSRE